MGVDHDCIIAHNLTPEELPTLPSRLSAEAAPDLARAVKLLARAYNGVDVEDRQEYTSIPSYLWAEEEGEWRYDAPWHSANLLDPPSLPPNLAPGERIRWPIQRPTLLRLFSADEMWSRGYWIEYVGPAHLWLRVYRHCCVFGIARWYRFLTEQYFQYTMRLVAYELGRIIGSEKAIHVPDNAFPPSLAVDVVSESGTFTDVIERLRQECGPPAPTLASIEDRQDPRRRGDGYFIDDFADLRVAAAQ